MVKYVLTEEQEKKLNDADLGQWKKLNNKGQQAIKQRMAIADRIGLKLSEIKRIDL